MAGPVITPRHPWPSLGVGALSASSRAVGRGVCAIPTGVSHLAHGYKAIVDTTCGIVTGTAEAVGSCAYSTLSTMAEAVELGVSGSCKVIAKSAFGINDFEQAEESIFKHDRILSDPQDPNYFVIAPDKRTFAQRLGESIGHVFTGTSKAIASATVGGTYIVGNISSVASALSESAPSGYVAVAQEFASGINHLAMFSAQVGAELATMAAKTAYVIAKPIVTHPVTAVNIAAPSALIGSGLYMICDQGIKAANSNSILGKIGHISGAIIGAGVTAAGAILANSIIQSNA